MKTDDKTLDLLIAALQRCKTAEQLLLGVWCRMNHYSGGVEDNVIDQATMNELRDFFGFDDSE